MIRGLFRTITEHFILNGFAGRRNNSIGNYKTMIILCFILSYTARKEQVAPGHLYRLQ